MLLGVQLDDQVLLDGQIDVLAGGHLHHGALQRVLVPLQPLGHQNGGGVLAGQALELGGGGLDSLTSITSPALTR